MASRVVERGGYGPAPFPVGDGLARLDPESRSPYPSQNRNALKYAGTEGELDQAALNDLMGQVRRLRVPFFNVYVNPSPRARDLIDWAEAQGARPKVFLVALRHEAEVDPGPCPGRIRPITKAELSAMNEGSPDAGEETLGLYGEPGVHLLAMEIDGQVAGMGAVYVHDRAAYVGNVRVLPALKGRGVQRSLLAERVRIAKSEGADLIVCETYPFLATSYENLHQAGFRDFYERPIWRWERPRDA